MEQVMNYLPWIGVAIVVVVLVLLVRWILSLRRVVKPSEVHVVRRSKVTEIYGSIKPIDSGAGNNAGGGISRADETAGNVYYQIPSWVPVWGVEVQILPLHNFSVDLDGYEAYDKDKLPFVVDVTAFFRIADYRQAASRISDNDTLQEHLTSIVQSAVRSILANDTLEKIMTQRSVYGEEFTKEVNDNLKEWGIVPVKSIELMDVRDKMGEKVISNIMEKKKSFIDMESRKEVAKNRQEAEEAEILSEQEIALKKEEKEEKVGKRRAEREQAVGIADEKSKQEVKDQERLTKEKEMLVVEVGTTRQAEIDKKKVVIDAEAGKEKQRIEAEADVLVAEQNKLVAKHDAGAAFIQKTKDAEADLVKAKNEALGIEAKGAAEALAKEKLGQAEVAPQITLAHEIGNNQGYQTYLIEIKKVDALQAVGIEQAKNLGNADIKIIANAGSNVQEGVSSVMQLFSAKGGQAMNSMLEAFAGTELGQQLLGKICNAGNDAADKPITGASSNAGVQKPEADNKGKKK